MLFGEEVKAVIFDMDGVLLDTESLCRECWQKAAAERGIGGIGEAFVRCVGQNAADTLALLEPYCGGAAAAADFYARTGELFRDAERERGLSLMPFVRECLEGLRARGHRLAVASSTKRENVVRQLTAAGIFGFFETVTTGDLVRHSKPAPDIYLLSLGSLGLPAGACVAVEDSPNGVRAASRAGMRCVMVPDQIRPDAEMEALAWRIARSLRELL